MLQVLKLSFYPLNRSFYVQDTVSLALKPTLHILSSTTMYKINKDLLYSTGNYTVSCSNIMERKLKKNIYIYIYN